MTDAPAAVLPLMPFDEACTLIVGYLKKTVPMAFWSVSRYEDDRQVYLYLQDDAYGKSAGESHAWSDSFCQFAVTGSAPQIAPDAMAVPQYATAGVAQAITIGAYIGVPIRDGDGTLFGTLCGMDPVVQSGDLLEQTPLLHMLASLLGEIRHAETMHAEAVDREAELHWSAFHDQLTGLPNRAMFLDRVGHALELHRRGMRPLAVLVLDLDDFKSVNDSVGHASGDLLLAQVASRLHGAVRPTDTLARLGGDEFAVLLEDGVDPRAMADVLVAALAEPFTVDGTTVPVSASIGVTELSSESDVANIDVLMAQADVAMYSAKRDGRGGFALYNPRMTLPGARDLQFRDPLRHAIATGTIEAVYQPIVELRSGRVVAFEALARWRHEGKPIPPTVFIPIAARAGLLSDLTYHVLELACAQLAAWSARLGRQRLQVSVNIPPSLFGDQEFPGRVEACIRRHGLGREQVVLEITEDALLADPLAARGVARRLHEMGATLSLDDFGTGYSSLLHLQHIPLHSIKIDRGFTHDLDTNPETERFMHALLALGRDLGLRVIVEGVERATQAEMLRRLGCQLAQGYLFGRPAHPLEIDVLPDVELRRAHPVP